MYIKCAEYMYIEKIFQKLSNIMLKKKRSPLQEYYLTGYISEYKISEIKTRTIKCEFKYLI